MLQVILPECVHTQLLPVASLSLPPPLSHPPHFLLHLSENYPGTAAGLGVFYHDVV